MPACVPGGGEAGRGRGQVTQKSDGHSPAWEAQVTGTVGEGWRPGPSLRTPPGMTRGWRPPHIQGRSQPDPSWALASTWERLTVPGDGGTRHQCLPSAPSSSPGRGGPHRTGERGAGGAWGPLWDGGRGAPVAGVLVGKEAGATQDCRKKAVTGSRATRGRLEAGRPGAVGTHPNERPEGSEGGEGAPPRARGEAGLEGQSGPGKGRGLWGAGPPLHSC